MSIPRTVAEVLNNHVTFELEGIDRMGSIQWGQVTTVDKLGVTAPAHCESAERLFPLAALPSAATLAPPC